jgi:hypothetical protein
VEKSGKNAPKKKERGFWDLTNKYSKGGFEGLKFIKSRFSEKREPCFIKFVEKIG